MKPGAATALNHWHENEDEFVIVLSGEVVLVEGDTETLLKAGECAGFKAGDPLVTISLINLLRLLFYLK